MNYLILSGSTRKNSQSLKSANYIKNMLCKHKKTAYVETVCLNELKLPFWDECYWDDDLEKPQAWNELSKKFVKADGIILIVPEWDGMAPPALKNIFNFASQGELFHKPCLIVSVSSGVGGTYPVVELRISSYKNSRLCYLPEHVILRNIGSYLNGEHPETDEEIQVIKRLQYALDILEAYVKGFITIRKEKVIKQGLINYGM